MLTQSLAIIEYLDKVFAYPRCCPPTPWPERGSALSAARSLDSHPLNTLACSMTSSSFGADSAAVKNSSTIGSPNLLASSAYLQVKQRRGPRTFLPRPPASQSAISLCTTVSEFSSAFQHRYGTPTQDAGPGFRRLRRGSQTKSRAAQQIQPEARVRVWISSLLSQARLTLPSCLLVTGTTFNSRSIAR